MADAFMLPKDGVGLHFITGKVGPQPSKEAGGDWSGAILLLQTKKRKLEEESQQNVNAYQSTIFGHGLNERQTTAGKKRQSEVEQEAERKASFAESQSIVDELNTILQRKSLDESYFSEVSFAIERAANVNNIDVETLDAARVYLKKLQALKKQIDEGEDEGEGEGEETGGDEDVTWKVDRGGIQIQQHRCQQGLVS